MHSRISTGSMPSARMMLLAAARRAAGAAGRRGVVARRRRWRRMLLVHVDVSWMRSRLSAASACGSAAAPVASAMMFSWVIGLPARAADLAVDVAFAHHEHAVADADDLGQLAGDHEHRDALPRQLVDDPVDLATWRRCRRRGSARRGSAPWGRSPASARAAPSAGCRPRALPTVTRGLGDADPTAARSRRARAARRACRSSTPPALGVAAGTP